MQDITPKIDAKTQLIQSYGPAGFRIASVDYVHSVLVTADRTTTLDKTDLAAVTIGDFDRLWEQSPPLEVVLIGTGKGHQMIAPALKAQLKAKGIGVDAMATGPAARTFNVLLGEERRVAALLLVPQP